MFFEFFFLVGTCNESVVIVGCRVCILELRPGNYLQVCVFLCDVYLQQALRF